MTVYQRKRIRCPVNDVLIAASCPAPGEDAHDRHQRKDEDGEADDDDADPQLGMLKKKLLRLHRTRAVDRLHDPASLWGRHADSARPLHQQRRTGHAAPDCRTEWGVRAACPGHVRGYAVKNSLGHIRESRMRRRSQRHSGLLPTVTGRYAGEPAESGFRHTGSGRGHLAAHQRATAGNRLDTAVADTEVRAGARQAQARAAVVFMVGPDLVAIVPQAQQQAFTPAPSPIAPHGASADRRRSGRACALSFRDGSRWSLRSG